MTEDEKHIKGVRFQDGENPDVLYCGPYSQVDAVKEGITYNDIARATERYLVEEEGFDKDCFRVTRAKDPANLLVKVEFIDDGATMAKIRGLIE
jgi:hypothetical protein